MAKVKLSDAPGCIGSPLIRAERHPICRNCVFTNVCGKLAERNAERLKADLGIKELSPNTGKKLTPGAEKLTIAQLENAAYEGKKPLTAKGAQLQRSILKAGDTGRIIQIMIRKSRPHVEHGLQLVSPKWARELLLLIWDNDGEVRKRDLREHLEHGLGHKRFSAMSDVSNFVNATTNMDLTIEDKEKLRINYETAR